MTGRFGFISHRHIVDYVHDLGRSYWPKGLPPPAIREGGVDLDRLGQRWDFVQLPAWASDIGVNGCLLIDAATIHAGDGASFDNCDWFTAAFSHVSGIAEVAHERRHGPVHSYKLRLPELHPNLFDHAWTNRILLLIRRAAVRQLDREENAVFGPLPSGRIALTHDIDALDKTGAIRVKQSLFEMFNVLRLLLKGRGRLAGESLANAACHALTTPSYDRLDETAELALQRGLRATFHVFSRTSARQSPREWLFDPAYYSDDPRLRDFVISAAATGFEFGLHPTFDSWDNGQVIGLQRQRLEEALGIPITQCRQHWLRFSWNKTWSAQQQAGLLLDSTLGFNDEPGFRTGTALVYRPWNFAANNTHHILQRPLILMDSHLYSYAPGSNKHMAAAIETLIAEVRTVGGEAAVLWHPHTLAPDYNWSDGYTKLLQTIAENH